MSTDAELIAESYRLWGLLVNMRYATNPYQRMVHDFCARELDRIDREILRRGYRRIRGRSNLWTR